MRTEYSAPEDALAALKRQRTTKLILVLSGLIAAVVAMIAASALMYSDNDYVPKPVNAAP